MSFPGIIHHHAALNSSRSNLRGDLFANAFDRASRRICGLMDNWIIGFGKHDGCDIDAPIHQSRKSIFFVWPPQIFRPRPQACIFLLKYPQGPPMVELFDEKKLSVWFTDKKTC